MKRLNLTFTLAFALMLGTSAWAQSYSFQTVDYPGDTFTQLLGINNSNKIAGYHNFNSNMGFTLTLPGSYTNENFPGSAMTQVIGINNALTTDGFYVDQSGNTHGFYETKDAHFKTVDFPGTIFNQLLSQNDYHQAAGYYSMSADNSTPDTPYIYDELGGAFEVINIPGAVGGAQATGINNAQLKCGFYIDAAGNSHGWVLDYGILLTLDAPGASQTQALGLNNRGKVVGFYTDQSGLNHGFVYTIGVGSYVTVDDPNGYGSTIVNGINDSGTLVGFYGDAPINHGFVATAH